MSDLVSVTAAANVIAGQPAQTVASGQSVLSTAERLEKYRLQALAKRLLPANKRLQACSQLRVCREDDVAVLYSKLSQSAKYGNLCMCGNPWGCPVCSAKITEQRARLLEAGVANAIAEGYTPALVTLTLSHDLQMSLSDTKAALKIAWNSLTRGRRWTKLRKMIGWKTQIRDLEVTVTDQNGWHPHFHLVAFLSGRPTETQQKAFYNALADRWMEEVAKTGYWADLEHGCDFTTADAEVVKYITKYGRSPEHKWSMVREVAKGPSKKAHLGGRTAFGLLADYGEGDHKAGRLFQEYALAMKNERQLYIPKSARDIMDLSAEKMRLAEESEAVQESFNVILASLDWNEWKRVWTKEKRGALLKIARAGDTDTLVQWLIAEGIRVPSPLPNVAAKSTPTVAKPTPISRLVQGAVSALSASFDAAYASVEKYLNVDRVGDTDDSLLAVSINLPFGAKVPDEVWIFLSSRVDLVKRLDYLGRIGLTTWQNERAIQLRKSQKIGIGPPVPE